MTANESEDGEALIAATEEAGLRMALLRAKELWDDEDYDGAIVLLERYVGDPRANVAMRLCVAAKKARVKDTRAEGVAALEAIAADDAADWATRELAATIASRVTEPRRRDQLTVASHLGVGGAMRAGALAAEVRTGFALDVPFGSTWRARAELDATPLATHPAMLWGYRVFLGPARSWPLGSGVFSVGLTANLGLWYAEGPWWQDGGQMQVGVHGMAWIDVRTGRNIGMGWELGSTWWPTLSIDLDGFGEPFELRYVIKVWFGTPPQMKLLPPEPSG